MNRIVALVVSLIMAASSKAGAVGAGATGVLLMSANAAGQIPDIPGVPVWLSNLMYGVGPTVAWCAFKLSGPLAAVLARISENSRRRALALEAIPEEKRPKGAFARIEKLHDRADYADAAAAGFDALRKEKPAA